MAAFEVIALDTATPQLRAPGAADTYTFPRAVEMPLGTANGVLYLNGSKVVTSGSALTFDGTNLGVGRVPSYVIDAQSASDAISRLRAAATFGAGFFGTLPNSETTMFALSDKRLTTGGTAGQVVALYSASIPIAFEIGSEQMRLTSTGLGIGTSSPTVKLDVNGAIRALIDPASAGYQNGIRLSDESSTTIALGLQTTGGSALPFLYGNSGIGFGTNLNERMRLDSSGNLGLGVTPSAWGGVYAGALQVGRAVMHTNTGDFRASFGQNYYVDGTNARYIGDGFATQLMQVSGDFRFFTAPNNTSGAGAGPISFTQAMTLDASGNLLVGRTAGVTGERFVIEGSNATFIARMRNTSATTPAGLFIDYTTAAPNDTGNLFLRCDDSAATRAEIRSNGGIANYQANDVNLSDRREKINFAPAKDYLDTICAIPVQTFNYIDQSADDPGLTLGVVAQDVQAVAPELVMESNWGTEDNPKMRLSIYQTDLQYALMKCIQELKAELDTVKAELATLKGTHHEHHLDH